MLTVEELSQRVTAGEIDTVFVGFTDLYGRLVGKRFDAGFFLEAAATQGAHACDYLLTVDMEMEPMPGYRFANWEKGYGDIHMVPDLGTLRVASWLDRTAIVQCDVRATPRPTTWCRWRRARCCGPRSTPRRAPAIRRRPARSSSTTCSVTLIAKPLRRGTAS